jgi:hypothetical protein
MSSTKLINEEHSGNCAKNLNSSVDTRSKQTQFLRGTSSDKVGGEIVSDTGSTTHLLEESEGPSAPESRPERLLLDEHTGGGDRVLLMPENIGADLVEFGLDFGGSEATEFAEGLACGFDLVCFNEPSGTKKS